MRISDWSSDVCSSDLLIGVCGATLFYGDGVITPAISVVGAMEGLEVVAPSLDRYVVSGSLVILIGLFMIQRFGTGQVGKSFGPENGRASWRERGCRYVLSAVGAGTFKQKNTLQ